MVQSIPSKLYKYQTFNEKTRKNLENSNIWFSKPSKFNDPFDCVINFTFEDMAETQWNDLYNEFKLLWEEDSNQNLKESLQIYFKHSKPSEETKDYLSITIKSIMKQELEEKIQPLGIACFSENVSDILMWSHYANSHQGFCLEFDTKLDPFNKAIKVEYSDKFPVLNPTDKSNHPLWILASRKATGWAYEKEWRLFHEKGDTAFRFATTSLTGIYFGCKMLDEHKEIVLRIINGKSISVFQSKISETNFRVEFQKIS